VASFLLPFRAIGEFTLELVVLISFREWLHSYCVAPGDAVRDDKGSSHLFQRVASFLPKNNSTPKHGCCKGSHLFQRVASFLPLVTIRQTGPLVQSFSSLSESGFIPTFCYLCVLFCTSFNVLISFREWLHSYILINKAQRKWYPRSSHLFQRVASFLQVLESFKAGLLEAGVLISFREWLHSYRKVMEISTMINDRSHLFQRVASFLRNKGT